MEKVQKLNNFGLQILIKGPELRRYKFLPVGQNASLINEFANRMFSNRESDRLAGSPSVRFEK
jgi:hypothetical protein